jgi:hypothetical protein
MPGLVALFLHSREQLVSVRSHVAFNFRQYAFGIQREVRGPLWFRFTYRGRT